MNRIIAVVGILLLLVVMLNGQGEELLIRDIGCFRSDTEMAADVAKKGRPTARIVQDRTKSRPRYLAWDSALEGQVWHADYSISSCPGRPKLYLFQIKPEKQYLDRVKIAKK